MLLSKIVLDRKINARAVLASIENHGAEVAAQLDEVCGELRDENAPPPDHWLMMQDLARLLKLRQEELEAADWAHLQEEANDRRLRRDRDETSRRLHEVLVEISGTLDGAHGPGVAEETLGLGVGLRPRPEQMLELSRKALDNFEKPGFELPPARLQGVELDLEAFKSQIVEHQIKLLLAIEALAAEKRKFEKTLAVKRLALDAFDRVYRQSINVLEAFFRLAGNDELADRIRPTVPQSQGTAEEPAPETGGEPVAEEPVGEPPAEPEASRDPAS